MYIPRRVVYANILPHSHMTISCHTIICYKQEGKRRTCIYVHVTCLASWCPFPFVSVE